MSYNINPDGYCANEGCTRPKATGEEVCSQCARLARAVGADPSTIAFPRTYRSPQARRNNEDKLPRCIAYLSMAGDVITLELTGGPPFTVADVEAVAGLLSNRRKPPEQRNAA